MRILADDWHVLTGSYALDALPDPEQAEFERHLQHCLSCDAEVRGLMAGPSTVLASAVVPGDRIGITVEPAGGTSKPTTTPVAVLPA